MGTAVVVTKTLAERMYDRVKGQLGDMVTDDDLKPIVEKAIHDAFFAERGYTDQYGRRQDIKPPYLVEIIQKEMRDRVKHHVDEWFVANPETAAQVIEQVIAKGLVSVAVQHVEQAMRDPFYKLVEQLRQRGVAV